MLSVKLSRDFSEKFEETESIPLRIEAANKLKGLAKPWNSLSMVSSCESTLKDGNIREVFLQLSMLRMVTMKQFLDMDQRPRFLLSKQRAISEGTFQNHYDLAVSAFMAKQFSECLQASEAAWALRDQENVLSMVADGMHNVQQLGALAAIELNQMQVASKFMIRSVDLPGRKWVRASPDLRAAKRLLAAQERESVIRYFVAVEKISWLNGSAEIRGWIEQLRQGNSPSLPE